jgi:hypothetical protein
MEFWVRSWQFAKWSHVRCVEFVEYFFAVLHAVLTSIYLTWKSPVHWIGLLHHQQLIYQTEIWFWALCMRFLTKYLLYEPHDYSANCVERFIGRINWFWLIGLCWNTSIWILEPHIQNVWGDVYSLSLEKLRYHGGVSGQVVKLLEFWWSSTKPAKGCIEWEWVKNKMRWYETLTARWCNVL